MALKRKEHWEHVYETKLPNEVSWTQQTPQTSIDFISSFGVDKTAKIIDVGGGDSTLVDHLLDLGYTDLTVLDISEKALKRAQKRLGDKAYKVKWIISDIADFKPATTYDVWHDRAAFHFLVEERDINSYLQTFQKAVTGYAIIGTFSKIGPSKCSGLQISQYDERSLTSKIGPTFQNLLCKVEDHTTPFDTQQNFLFWSYRKV